MRIGRGFYQDGVWLDSGFLPYAAIGGLTWREEPRADAGRAAAHEAAGARWSSRREHYGEARRLLRDKIRGHDIHFTGKALDLGAHDERDDV